MATHTSVSLTITNATRDPLYFSTRTKHAWGTPLTPQDPIVESWTTITLSGASKNDDTAGFLQISTNIERAGPWFHVDFVASTHSKFNALSVEAPIGYGYGVESLTIDAHSVTAEITFYDGIVADPATGGTAIDLTAAPMTLVGTYPQAFPDFVNCMFDARLRTTDAITAATASIPQAPAPEASSVHYADFTGGQIPALVDIWAQFWLDGRPCAASDRTLINVFKGFMIYARTPLSLWIPRISLHKPGPPAVFNLEGYDRVDIFDALEPLPVWNADAVTKFLTLIASGAHIVSICADGDLAPIGMQYRKSLDFYRYFTEANIVRGNDLGSSHYATIINPSGWYFLDIAGETMPNMVRDAPSHALQWAGLLVAFMTSPTICGTPGSPPKTGTYNSFLQLEGWQQQGLDGGDRHMLDFDTSGATGWNISTFGASPYSEKRATTVFLAPQGWQPKVTQTTLMMPYAGAYALQVNHKQDIPIQLEPYLKEGLQPQPWLKRRRVRIDDDAAQALDPRFIYVFPSAHDEDED